MAITQGVGPHNGWVEVNGQRFQVISGNVHETSTNTGCTMRARLPLNAPGYLEAFAGLRGSDTDVTVIVLAHGSEANLFKGKLIKIEFSLVQGFIDLQGDNGHQELHDHKTTDSWTNATGTKVVSDLVGRLGIPFIGGAQSKAMIGKKIGQDFVALTDNVSYMMKIHKCAEFDGVRAFFDRNGSFRYQKAGQGGSNSVMWNRPTSQKPMVSDTLDLRIIYNLPAGDTLNGEQTSYQTDKKQNSSAKATVQGGPKQRQYYGDTPPNQQQEQNYQRVTSALDSMAQHEFQLNCTVVGDPDIDATKQITLSGTQFFDMSYPIDSVDHNFGVNGYTTTVNGKTAGQGRSAQ